MAFAPPTRPPGPEALRRIAGGASHFRLAQANNSAITSAIGLNDSRRRRMIFPGRTPARDMPIRPFLAGQAFEPDLIRSMSMALESVCETLRLKLVDDAATRLVASKIIELAERGVKDAATLTTMTLREFKHD